MRGGGGLEEGNFLGHHPCPKCGSSDGRAEYDDGHSYCFVCESYESQGEVTVKPRRAVGLIEVDGFISLAKRRLTEETCRKFGYGFGKYKGQAVHVAPYYKDGELVAQHLRTPDKEFPWVGSAKGVELFGQHLWKSSGGKRLVITEGEIDAMSFSQAFNNSWPVVSIPSGAGGAVKAVKDNLDFVESYDEVVIAFDNDKPGREATAKVATLLTPGKAKMLAYPEGYKDGSDMLQAGKVKEMTVAVWEAKQYRPDGILSGSDLWEACEKDIEWGLSYPWATLTNLTYGIRLGELVALGAGTGLGKTDVFKEIALHLATVHGEKVGIIFLEEAPKHTALCLAGKYADKTFHIPKETYTKEEKQRAFDKVFYDTHGSDRIFLYNHFGFTDWDTIKAQIRFMSVSFGVKYIFLDHITALVSGDKDGDERKSLDYIMTDMATLVRSLPLNIHFISHLATPEGKPHEEGGRVMIKHFRGSRAIGQWSSFMFGLERDQQAEDATVRHRSVMRCLKDRYTGQSTGEKFFLRYNPDTGRIHEDSDQSEAAPGDFIVTTGGGF